MKHLKIIFPLLIVLILSCGILSWWLNDHFAPLELKTANALIEEKKLPQAIQAYQELIKKFPEKFVPHYNLGNLYFYGQQYAPAEQSYKQSLDTPDLRLRRYALYNLGDTAFCQNKLKEALSYFQDALAMDQNYDKARQNADFTREIQTLMKENPDQAAQMLQESCLKKDQQKKDEDKKEDEKKDQKDEKEDKDKDENKNNQQENRQKPDEQKNQQEAGDEDRQKQGQQGQEPQQDQGNDQPPQQGQQQESEPGEQKSDEQEQDQDQQAGQEQDKKQQEGQEQQAQSVSEAEEGSEFQGRYDANPEPWLNSLNDDPSRALKYLILKKGMDKKRRFDKNW